MSWTCGYNGLWMILFFSDPILCFHTNQVLWSAIDFLARTSIHFILDNDNRPALAGDKLIHPLSTYLHTNYANTCYPLSFFGWLNDRVSTSTTVYYRIKIEQKTRELPFFAHFYFFRQKFNDSQLPGILFEQIHFKLRKIWLYCEGMRDETLLYKKFIFNTVWFRMYQTKIYERTKCYLQGVPQLLHNLLVQVKIFKKIRKQD